MLDDVHIGRACVLKVLRGTQVMHLPVTPIKARGV